MKERCVWPVGFAGQIFECFKGSKAHGTVKGKFYVYHRGGDLRTYSTRSVVLLANGDEILGQPRAFQLARVCPFCGLDLTAVGGHDGAACAAEWDARVKKYCLRCNADLVKGQCPKCDGEEAAA